MKTMSNYTKALISQARRVVAERRKNQGDLSNDFMDGFEEGVAELTAAMMDDPNIGASDVLDLIGNEIQR